MLFLGTLTNPVMSLYGLLLVAWLSLGLAFLWLAELHG
jgi:hypothetical protein